MELVTSPAPFFVTRLRSSSRSRRLFSFQPVAMASYVSQSSKSTTAGDASGASDVFQQVQSYQAGAIRLPPIEEVRTILDNSVCGILSTHSQEHEGYPSGSMVDFACDHDGSPILAISNLAAHSKNLLADPRCSLLVAKDPEDHTDIAITLLGDGVVVSENDREAAHTAYLRRHPSAFAVDFGDFRFFQIKPKFVQYVTGVATAMLGSGEFKTEEYQAGKVDPIYQFSVPISFNMNKDHAEDTKAIVQHCTSIKVEFAYLLDVDSLGFNVKAGLQGYNFKLRIPFPRPAQHRKDVKNLIIELHEAAKTTV